MTLVVAVTGEQSIWLLTDRRITFHTPPPKDDARKLLFLETTDGLALLGYAGLGSTALGTEPGDWMARVLRGRNLPLEQSLAALADAVRLNFPQHLDALPVHGPPAHHIIIPAFLNREPRLYSIDLVRPRDRRDYSFRFTRHVTGRQRSTGPITPRIAIGGSGAAHLLRDRRWVRELLRAVTAHDAGRISPQKVASALAHVNHQVAKEVTTVGQRCIVAWRFQKGGGGQEFFTREEREVSSSFVWLPTIAQGQDVTALVQVVMPFTIPILAASLRGETKEMDTEAINAELAKLPLAPDDRLA
jgi:hypothetical protein